MICPTDAISIPELAPNKLQKLGELPDGEEVANLLRGRRSIRSFRNKNLDSDLLKKIISLASTAPSFHNSQTTEFVVIQNPKTLRLIEEYTTETMRKLVKAYKNVLTRPLFKLMFRKQINAAVSLVPFVEFAVQEQMAGRSIIFHDAPVVIVFHGHKGKMMAKENAQLCIQNALMQLLLWVLVASIVPWSLLLRQETNVY
jgi:nitroreductase